MTEYRLIFFSSQTPLYKTMQAIKNMTKGKLPVYAIVSTVVVATFYHHGPESMGGGGDLHLKLEKISHLEEKEKFLEGQKVRSFTMTSS